MSTRSVWGVSPFESHSREKPIQHWHRWSVVSVSSLTQTEACSKSCCIDLRSLVEFLMLPAPDRYLSCIFWPGNDRDINECVKFREIHEFLGQGDVVT